jgi:gliding motility-associated-like protein
MKKFLTILILSLGLSFQASATHIFGGELLYTWMHDNTYRLTLTMYGDCSSSVFSSLHESRPFIAIYNGATLYDTLRLDTLLGSAAAGIEVSPVCPGQLKNTTCNNGTLPGVKKFIYTDTIDLKTTSTAWSFIFAGDFLVSAAGRSSNITNVTPSSVGLVYLVATLDNSVKPNNSPTYTTIPTPFYCINLLQQYNQGATDADGDSLSFALTPALNGGSPVSYVSPFTYDHPLGADTFSFNKLNGQLSFLPNIIQDGLVVTKVSEFRNGRLVGTSMREMTFIVLSNCNTDPPKADISAVVGGYERGNVITLCHGTPLVSFNISAYNSNNDTILATPVNVPSSAALNITNNYTPNPSLSFSWNTSGLANGIYNFFVNYKNFHCPIASSQTIAYTLIVVPPYTISFKLLSPTQCVHQAYVELDITDGIVPRLIKVMQGSTTVRMYNDSTGTVRDSLPIGNYSVIVSSENNNCPVSYNFSIPDSGTLPDPYTNLISYCRYEQTTQIDLPFVNGSSVQWYDEEKQPITSAPTPSSSTPGNYLWFVSETYKTCSILYDSVPVVIYDLPHIKLSTTDPPICMGDKISLSATGGVQYKWLSTHNKVYNSSDSNAYSLAYDSATYKVVVSNEHDCKDSATASYPVIQRCCQFSYPSAFTPNHDGRNDVFKILTYGNLDGYYLIIYDRWGQEVFTSVDPGTGWDGTYKGKPCEVGTYFYLLRAQCLTGHYEEHKGDLILIR